ncbi:MAG TPA: F0F1 ATP synthase subunit A [Opitutaceae bacterium]|nr:F0F1 ATP synthase subunit A [Opitutaceae bacterium]
MTGRVILCALLAPAAAAVARAEGGVAPAASKLFEIPGLGLPVTNSIVTSWVVSLLILVGLRLMVKKPQLIPSRGQAIVESALEALRGLYQPIVGKKAFPGTFPILVCLFLYILLQNWSGLIPGVGSIGLGHVIDGKFHVTEPFIRPANADWNGTIALAAVAMFAWAYLILRYAGPKLILHDLFGNKADKNELAAYIYYPLSVIFLIVGFIEVVSICIRPFTLSVRLFGNVFGGENLLHSTGFIFPFYFLETLVGFVQALVFTLLLSVYIGLICNHGDDEHGHAEAHH